MKRVILPALVPLLLAQAPAGTVEVTVTGVRNARGHVLVAVCPREQFLRPECPWRGGAPAREGDVLVRVVGVPPGTYAAQAFHDENDNRVIDRNIFGIPREGMGFSNDAKMRFGPPSFDDAAFRVTPGGAKITFALRYFD